MALDDKGNEIVEENIEQNQQEENQQLPADTGSKDLDKQLEKFIEDSTRGTAKGAPAKGEGEGEEGKDKPKLGADGKPIAAKGTQQQPVNRGTQQAPAVQQVPSRAAAKDFGSRYQRNAQSDIIDKLTGKVVAKAGAAYGVAQNFLPYIAELEGKQSKLETTLKAVQDAQQLAIKEGLTVEETALGTRLMVSYKKDPVATIKFLLNQAQEGGKDVSSLTGGQTLDPTIITRSMEEQIKKAMEPFMFLVQDRDRMLKQTEEQEEAATQAASDYQEFIGQFPDANTQDAEIGALMSAQNLSMKEAYFALKAHCFEQKYDWSKPIGPQITARRAAAGGRAPNGGGQNRRDLPNLNARGGSSSAVKTDRVAAGVETSYADIIKGVLQDAGIDE